MLINKEKFDVIVIKRDGKKVKFNPEKILLAVQKAEKATGLGLTEGLAEEVTASIQHFIVKKKSEVSVEEIQDLVEKKLMGSKRKDVAKAYTLYRNERSKVREGKSFETLMSIVNVESSDVARENANMCAETPAGMMMKFASETTKRFTASELLKPDENYLHQSGAIHIHDLDYYPTRSMTCVQHPLDVIFNKGFEVNHASLRVPNSIHGAAVMAAISLETAQNEMHGGQSIPAFDFYLAPFVRVTFEKELKQAGEIAGLDSPYSQLLEVKEYKKMPLDGLTGKERVFQHAINRTVEAVYQAMEGFIHNMNSIHSRGGNQVVFSSINYGTDTSAEGRCVMEQLLLSTERGVGNGQTAIFPIQIFKIKSGVNLREGEPNYDLFQLACRVTAKRFFPNFLNLDTPFNQHEKWKNDDPKRYLYETATMGCRTRVFENMNGEKTSIGRGNGSFTSINLVRLALETLEELKGHPEHESRKLDIFYRKLGHTIAVVANQLKERYDFQKRALAKQFPTVMKYLWTGGSELKPEDRIEKVINQCTLGIGFIGLAETLIALTGQHHGESEQAQELGLAIVRFMKTRVDQFKEETHLNYSVLATPAESLCYRFPKLDRNRFGVVEGVNDRDYYTNSNHVPVWHKISAKKKMEIEAPYHELTLGGHISYIELDGKAIDNYKSIEKMVLLAHKLNIGYFSLNHTASRCLDCSYEGAEADLVTCPECGSEHIDILQRITGYLVGTTKKWNNGKQAELKDRVNHM